jgi:succinoglycan biosynthesis protein ExoM
MGIEHIVVCICTFQRPSMLGRLLSCLEMQRSANRFTWSAVVVDNDAGESARATVEAFRARSRMSVSYTVVAEQNIACARNAAVDRAEGTYIAFIDDDEFPSEDWLILLLETCRGYNADGVLAPVLPHFETPPPQWVMKGRVFDRPMHTTGHWLNWENTRTGNVLFRNAVFSAPDARFNPLFSSGGEDREFFRRMIAKGFRFVWCAEAAVLETVPAFRWDLSFLFRRALLRGQTAVLHDRSRTRGIVKSVAAGLFCASALLPSLLSGQHVFVNYLVRLGDHLGRLFASIGIKLIREKYVTQ